MRLPMLRNFIRQARYRLNLKRPFNSALYWERRYRKGGTSGAGSYDRLAQFKADFLNDFVESNGITRVIEWGSGDGAQLEYFRFPQYIGVDVAPTVVELARQRLAGRRDIEILYLPEAVGRTAQLALSLDVIYHLVEDEVFESYMRNLFDSAERFVVIYSSNEDNPDSAEHVRHRHFTGWIEKNRPDFLLRSHTPNRFPFDASDPSNTSFADFYVFERRANA